MNASGLLVAGVRAFQHWVYGTRIEGQENLPRTGPCIIGSNEISNIAIVGTSAVYGWAIHTGRMPRPVSFIDDFYEQMLWGRLFGAHGTQRVMPFGRGRSVTALLNGLQALEQGEVLLANPEGEMSWNGQLAPFHSGVAWLAIRSGAPFVPVVATAGAYEIWPRWASRPHLSGHYDIRIGAPLYLSPEAQPRVTPEMVAAANERLRQYMSALIYG